jgi:hypothetical protein
MKKTVLIIGLLFLSLSNFAQDKNTILGKWTFKDAHDKESMEADELKMVMTMFKDLSLEFKESEVVLTMMGKSEPAQWSFSETDTKIIDTVSKTGKKAQLTIAKFDEKEMVITIGRAGPFVMSKS